MSTINTNDQKMRNFADYVSEFASAIMDECDALESATQKLASSMSAEEMQFIESMANKIESILLDAAPEFKKLYTDLNVYADYVEKARKIATRGN